MMLITTLNMKCIKRLVAMFVATASVLFAVSCSEETANVNLASKDNMIPDNAILAVKVMPEQLWSKLVGNPHSEASRLWNMAKLYLPLQINKYGELGKVIKSAIDDPTTLGVCLDEPVVMTLSLDKKADVRGGAFGEMCYVALLEDSNSFVKAVDALVEYAKEDCGIDITKSTSGSFTHYQAILEDKSIDLGVTSESAVLRYSVNPSNDLQSSMGKLFANRENASKSGVTEFYSSTSDLTLWLDVDGTIDTFMPILKIQQPGMAALLEGESSFYEGTSILTQLDFKKGETVMSLDMCGSDKIKELAQKYLAVASDKQFKSLPNSLFVTANVAIKDLSGLVDEICSLNGEYAKKLKEVGIDDDILAGGPGLISVAFTPLEGKLQCGLAIECDKNVWDFLKDNISKKSSEDLLWYSNDICIVNDEAIVMYDAGAVRVYSRDAYNFTTYGDTFDMSNYAGEIKKGGVVVNLHALDDYPQLFEALDLAALVMSFSEDFTGVKLSLKMDDEESTLLEKFVGFAALQNKN